MNVPLLPFDLGWYSFELPGYRPCDNTYCLFSYEDLPPLSAEKYDAELSWLPPLDHALDERMKRYRLPVQQRAHVAANLQKIIEAAKQLRISLPESFLTMMASEILQDRIPSCTACYFELSDTILPCPGNKEGIIIRFLNDQQGVLAWYLYMKPRGESCILVSSTWLDDVESAEGEQIELMARTHVCAMSFDEFIYRFWLENAVWFRLNEHAPLSEEQEKYLSYYSKHA